MLNRQFLDTTRGRIVRLLHAGGATADEMAAKLGLTANAVRSQITQMERDGLARRVGQRPGTTRPSQVYELTAEAEQLLSRAYVPLLAQLVRVFTEGLPASQIDAFMREAGRGLAEELSAGRARPSLRARVDAASHLLNEQLGAVTHVEENGSYVIRGAACPLAALTGKHPAACLAIESFVAEIVGARVSECCDRTDRPRCCFEIATGRSRSG